MKQKLLQALYKFLAFCARIYLWRTKPFVIGVTGSVGKTCCRDIVTQVLLNLCHPELVSGSLKTKQDSESSSEGRDTQLKIYTSPKNYNSELGLVFSIFQIESYEPSVKNLLKLSWSIFKKSLFQKKQYDILVAEYGIDSSGDMDFLLTIMKPDISVLTKLDSVHSDNFIRGKRELWEDKWKLLLAAKQQVFFNGQDEFSLEHQKLLSKPHEKMFEKIPKTELKKSDTGLSQVFSYKRKEISINLLGDENIEYTILGLKIAETLGIQLSEQNYNFQYRLQPGRFSIFERNENIFIDSSYNAGPESMKKIITNTQLVGKELYPEYKIIYVLGDMREIGDAVKQAHTGIVPLVVNATAVFTVGPYMYEHFVPKLKKSSFSGELHSSLSSREIGLKLRKYLRENTDSKYLILFKGSQNTIFTEEALAAQLTSTQQKNLPRQTEDWKRKKDEFFKGV